MMLPSDSNPICRIHGAQMNPATHWITLDGRPFPKPCFVCPVSGCLQVWDSIKGHSTEPEGAVIGSSLGSAVVRLKYLGR
jgi:hypothetical protein